MVSFLFVCIHCYLFRSDRQLTKGLPYSIQIYQYAFQIISLQLNFNLSLLLLEFFKESLHLVQFYENKEYKKEKHNFYSFITSHFVWIFSLKLIFIFIGYIRIFQTKQHLFDIQSKTLFTLLTHQSQN